MLKIRPAHPDDLDGLYDLAVAAGPGMTSLPADRDDLAIRVLTSCADFSRDVAAPAGEYYLLVAEDTATGEIVGTANVVAGIGLKTPALFFQINTERRAVANGVAMEDLILTPALDRKGYAEVGGLVVSPKMKGTGIGRLLSRSRYMLMACAPNRFPAMVMANIRGWLDTDGRSPVWEAVGRRFFDGSFDDIDRLYGRGEKAGLIARMPRYPIYAALLPDSARAALGKPHEASRPALNMLLEDGFRDTGTVFFLDAGPCVEVNLLQIKAVAQSRVCEVALSEGSVDGPMTMAANPSWNGFAVVAAAANASITQMPLSIDAARALNVSVGQSVRVSPLKAQG